MLFRVRVCVVALVRHVANAPLPALTTTSSLGTPWPRWVVRAGGGDGLPVGCYDDDGGGVDPMLQSTDTNNQPRQ